MNRAVGVLKMHLRDKWSWLLLPWTICLSSFVINLVVGATINEPEGFYVGGVASIFVYLFIMGILTLQQSFPFALGMGVRRTDYFLGTAAMAVLVSAMTSALLILLSAAEAYWTDGWGVGLHFFKLPFMNEGPEILQAVTFFLLLLNLYFAGFAISSIHRKFGPSGLYVFFTLLFLICVFTPLLVSYYDRWDEIGRWAERNFHNLNDLEPWLLLLIGLCALGSYGLLRRSTV